MSRVTYVYDPEKGEMVEKSQYRAPNESAMIMPDIPDFQSPIDGSIVHGRRSLRDHNKQHGVTNVADYTKTWEGKAKERADAFTPGSGYDGNRRREQLVRSYDKLRNR